MAVLAVVAVLATGLGKDPSATASPLVGRAAPDFTLGGIDGPAVTLSKLRGQVVVVNFWASWCTECHDEQDALDQTWQRSGTPGWSCSASTSRTPATGPRTTCTSPG